MNWKSPGSLTNTERRRVVPAPHGPGHAGDVGVALEESGTGVGYCPRGHKCTHNPAQGLVQGPCIREQDTQSTVGCGERQRERDLGEG